jgi:hypothetical protein
MASAVVHVALLGVTAFFALVLGIVPFENQPPDSHAQDWLLVLAPVLVVLAIAFGRGALRRNVKVMAGAWLVEFLLVGAVLFATIDLDPGRDDYTTFFVGALLLLGSCGVATVTVPDSRQRA